MTRYEVIKGKTKTNSKTVFAVVDTKNEEKPILLHVKETAEQVAFFKNAAEAHILEPDGVQGVILQLIERDRGNNGKEEKNAKTGRRTGSNEKQRKNGGRDHAQPGGRRTAKSI